MQPLIHLHILASGSKGNATIVEGPTGSVLIDCGISRKQLLLRAAELDVDTTRIQAAIFTHEHSDHVSGLPVFARRFGGDLYITRRTALARTSLTELPFSFISHDDQLSLAGMTVRTFSTSHDVADPIGLHFLVMDNQGEVLDSVGWCTDTGQLTTQARAELRGCRVLGIEANHDVRMLATGPYPSYLKARVGGAHGHLSNDQCAEAVRELADEDTTTVVALHISEKNNLPSLAEKALRAVVSEQQEVLVAGQNRPITVW